MISSVKIINNSNEAVSMNLGVGLPFEVFAVVAGIWRGCDFLCNQ